MTNTLQIKHQSSASGGTMPTDLEQGELAIDTYYNRLYYADAGNTERTVPLSYLWGITTDVQTELDKIVAATTSNIGTVRFASTAVVADTDNEANWTTRVPSVTTLYGGFAGSDNIVTTGALASGSLAAGFTAVGVAQGGTGKTTVGSNRILTGDGTDPLVAEATLLYEVGNLYITNTGTDNDTLISLGVNGSTDFVIGIDNSESDGFVINSGGSINATKALNDFFLTSGGAGTFLGALAASNLSGTNTGDQTVAYTSAISEGNSGLVPSAGTSGHFLKHDGTFGLPSYTTNTNTQLTNAQVIAKVLTGLSTSTGGAVAAADTILVGVGKLEKRVALNDAKVTNTTATRASLSIDTDDNVTFGNLSGTNTGDQTLPTRNSLSIDTDDNVTFANITGNKVDVDDIEINGKVIKLVGGGEGAEGDYASITAVPTSNSSPTDTLVIATVDSTHSNDAGIAHMALNAAGDITLDANGQIKLEPFAGNNILLDGTIAIDAGVVTGATSITSTAFVGALTGNASTATLATTATNITAVANNTTNETTYPTFVDAATGTQGIETDTGMTYNPSTGALKVNRLIVSDIYSTSGTEVIDIGDGTAALLGWTTVAAPIANAGMYIKNGTSSSGFIRFYEDDVGGDNHYMTFKGATTLGNDNIVFELPATNGVSGYALLTNGSGVTSWGTASAFHGLTNEIRSTTMTGAVNATNSAGLAGAAPAASGTDEFNILTGGGLYAVNYNPVYTPIAVTGASAILRLAASGTSSGNQDITLADSGGMTITATNPSTITFSSADTNTTYSAGSNMSLSGTTFSSTDTNTTYSATSKGGVGLSSTAFSLDVDGMDDIGAALVDADLFIVDDGAGGTNRKATMSRLATYMQGELTFTTARTDTEINTLAQAKIDSLVASAPSALDTLNELAAAIGDDASYASTITTALALKSTIASPTFTGIVTIPNVANLETAVVANTAKNTNVSTNLSVSASGSAFTVASSDGNNASLTLADTNNWGVMSDEMFDKLDGVDASANNYSLPVSASGTRGGVKIGYSESGKNYPVELASEKMFVNVPWTDTDTNTTYSAGSNMSLSGTTFSATDTNTTYSAFDGGTGDGLVPGHSGATSSTFLRGDATWVTPTDTNTTYTGGTNLTLSGTTFNVDDAFLKNNASDTTSGTITAGGFTTTGTWTIDEYTSGTIGITTVQDSGTTFNDNDTSLMTAAAINDQIGSIAGGGEPNQNAWTTITVPSGTTSQAAASTTDTIAFTAAGGMTITGGSDTIAFSSADTNTTYTAGTNMSLSGTEFSATDTNTTYSAFDGGTGDGLVPGHSGATSSTFLRGDATWVTPTDTNTTYSAGSNMSLSGTTFSATDTNTTYSAGTGIALSSTTFSMADPADGTSIDEGTIATDDRMPIWDESASSWKYVTIDNLQDEIDTDTDTNTTYTAGTNMSLSGTEFSATDTNTTYSAFDGGTGDGLVPGHSGATSSTFLRGDATWVTPTDTNTTYSAGSNMSLSGTTFSATDTNTTYSAGTGITLSGTTFSMMDPASGTSIDEGTIATDDRMPIWDESASSWKYVTIDNLQDEIDTTGSGGENNEFSFKNVAVSGQTTIVADSSTDTLTFAASGGMTLTTSGNTATFSSADTNTTYSAGSNMSLSGTTFSATDTNTTYSAGTGIALSSTTFSMADPADGTSIDEGTIATDDRMPIWDESASSWKYVTIDNLQDEIDTNTDTNTTYSAGSNMSLSGTTFSATDTNTTYSEATGSAEGLMSVAHHDKLDGIASSANNYSHPTGAGNKHVPTAGAAGQVLKYSSSGTPVWAAPVVAGTGLGMVGSGNTLTHTSHSGDATGATALTLATVNSNVGSFTNTSITVNAKGLITAASTGSGGGGVPTEITVVDESSDQTCFPLFVTGASGDLAPKTGSNLTFDSAAGKLTASLFLGPLTGDVTGNITGNAATVTTNANLTGDVTSSGNATTIATDAVDIAMLSASGTASSTTFLRGDNSWVTPTDTTGVTSNVAGNAITVSGATGAVTINHEDTSSQASVNNSGTTAIQDITLDTYGHVTSITSADVGGGGGGGANIGTGPLNDRIAIWEGADAIGGQSNATIDATGNAVFGGTITSSSAQVCDRSATTFGAAVGHGVTIALTSGLMELDYMAPPPSDERLKTGITTFEYGLNEIKAISPKWYKFSESSFTDSGLTNAIATGEHKDGYFDLQRYGLMAGDVKAVMPKLVSKIEDDKDYETYDKDALIFVLINAIKELEARLVTLEAA